MEQIDSWYGTKQIILKLKPFTGDFFNSNQND